MKINKILPVIVLLLLVGIGAFVYLSKKSSPEARPEIRKMQEEVVANCKYDADFCKYMAKGIVAMSGGYTITSESTVNGKKTKMIMNSDGHENSQTTTYTDGKEEGSFITLDKTMYTKSPGETEWTEFPQLKDENGATASNLFDFESLKKELGSLQDEAAQSLTVKKLGSEACGKLTCTVFALTEKALGSETKIWVDTKDYFARKMQIGMKDAVTTMNFEYGPVTIKKPSPVKKMPDFQNSVKDSGVNINPDEIKNIMKNYSQNGAEGVPETPTGL